MSLSDELSRYTGDHFTALILDNEVTVEAFALDPPLPWIRLVFDDGAYVAAKGYPAPLTSDQARAEGRLWDRVSGLGMLHCLNELGDGVDYVVFGNNAGQGLPLAGSLPEPLRARNAAIIYAEFLPQEKDYEALGYREFLRRDDLIAFLSARAAKAGKPLMLAFINTIQHDETNFHTP